MNIHLWIIDIQSDSGYSGHIVWRTDGGTYQVPPHQWWPSVTQKRDLVGNVTSLQGVTTVTVGTEPVLFE